MTPVCPYCQCDSQQVTGREVYPHRPDLHHKHFYRCTPCDALVGCHPGTIIPLGRLANAYLRKLKSQAHACFDPLWKEQGIPRGKAYTMLAKGLNIAQEDCHIGMFDEELCKRTIQLCNSREIFRSR